MMNLYSLPVMGCVQGSANIGTQCPERASVAGIHQQGCNALLAFQTTPQGPVQTCRRLCLISCTQTDCCRAKLRNWTPSQVSSIRNQRAPKTHVNAKTLREEIGRAHV